MILNWALANRDGDEKDFLPNRQPGSSVVIPLNDGRTGTVIVSSQEKASGQIHSGRTRVKVRAVLNSSGESVLVLNGLIGNASANDIDTTIPILDQKFRLLNATAARVFPLDGDVPDFPDEAKEISQGMWDMIRYSDKRTRDLNADEDFFAEDPAPEIGIELGSLADSGINRKFDPFDPGTVWDSLVEWAKKKGAPDFELAPNDGPGNEDGVHAVFNTYHPRKGTLKEHVVFEKGYTLSDVTWEPSVVDPGLCNRYILVGEGKGASAPVYVAENWGSIKALGLYTRVESAPSDMDIEDYEARAKGYVANKAWPVHFFDMVLPAELGGQAQGFNRDALGNLQPLDTLGEFGVPPECFTEYDVGDIVTVRADDLFSFRIADEEPGPKTDYLVRIMQITLTEVDRDGNVVVSLQCQPHEEDADQTGYEARIAVDPT